MAKIRTTIVLPEEDVKLIKVLAITWGLTMSEVVQQGIRKIRTDKIVRPGRSQAKKGWWKVMGSLDLKGKEPPSREEIYGRYLKEKVSR